MGQTVGQAAPAMLLSTNLAQDEDLVPLSHTSIQQLFFS